MSLPVKATIQALTPTAVAKTMGLPISTVFRWMKSDRIPGKGPAHEWRRDQFEAAVKRLRLGLKASHAATPRPRRRSSQRAAA